MNIKREYLIGEDIQEILKNTLYDLYTGKINFLGPDPKLEVIVETGIAGMHQFDKAIKEMAITSGLVVNASEIGSISDKREDYYASYTIPFLANVKFKINSEFDPVMDNDAENPIVNGYRMSSYNYRLNYNDNNTEDVAYIIATGIRPVFREELVNLIRKCGVDKDYDLGATRIMKYLMNCLNNLK